MGKRRGQGVPAGRWIQVEEAQPNELIQRRRLLAIQISGILWRAKSIGRRQEKRHAGLVFLKNCYIVNSSWVRPSACVILSSVLWVPHSASPLLTPRAKSASVHKQAVHWFRTLTPCHLLRAWVLDALFCFPLFFLSRSVLPLRFQ